MKLIGVHLDRCTGCKSCELYCAAERGSTGKTLLKAVQESPFPQARLTVEGNNQAPFPLQCRHCLQVPCLDACLAGALARDDNTGLVVLREDRCIGCWTCTEEGGRHSVPVQAANSSFGPAPERINPAGSLPFRAPSR